MLTLHRGCFHRDINIVNILILGKGYVGSALHESMHVDDSWSVTWLSKADKSYDDRNTFINILNESNYDVVINASGYTGRPNVDACETNIDDTWYYNVVVPGMLADVCNLFEVEFVQISSGCIYDGYEKAFDEWDEPNFGIPCIRSSWYSKTKHAGELALLGTNAVILRIRMPFCETTSERNVIMKLLKYNNIINQENSVTNIEDLVEFITSLIKATAFYGAGNQSNILNVVNPQPIKTEDIINMLKEYDIENPKWNFIDLDELLEKHTTTGRSNCVLSSESIEKMGFALPDTMKSLERCVRSIKDEMADKNLH